MRVLRVSMRVSWGRSGLLAAWREREIQFFLDRETLFSIPTRLDGEDDLSRPCLAYNRLGRRPLCVESYFASQHSPCPHPPPLPKPAPSSTTEPNSKRSTKARASSST